LGGGAFIRPCDILVRAKEHFGSHISNCGGGGRR